MLALKLLLGCILFAHSEGCVEECFCYGLKLLSNAVKTDLCSFPKYYQKCQISCNKCTSSKTSTTSSTVDITKVTTTPKSAPSTNKPKPTTTKPASTTKGTVPPLSGECGDYNIGCMILADHPDKESLCDDGYHTMCPMTCNTCISTDKCVNFQDQNYGCPNRNCMDDSNRIAQHRVLSFCSKTCCNRGYFDEDDLLKRDPSEQFHQQPYHPRLLKKSLSMFH